MSMGQTIARCMTRPSCAIRQFLVGGPTLAQLPVTVSPVSVFFTKGTECTREALTVPP